MNIVKAVKKEIKEGNIIRQFGTRLYIWDNKKKMAYVSRHLSDEEWNKVKHLVPKAYKGEYRIKKEVM